MQSGRSNTPDVLGSTATTVRVVATAKDSLIDDATESHSARGGGGRFQRRDTWFVGGVLLGLLLGIAGALIVPDLLPEGELDCVRPNRVVWSQEGSVVRLDVTYADDGADGCDAGVVFREPVRERNAG